MRSQRPATQRIWMFATAFLAFVEPVDATRADELVFQGGDRLRLRATTHGDDVVVHSPIGPCTFARSDFRRITPELWPEQAWPVRAAEASRGDAKAHTGAACWALGHGLVDEAIEWFEKAAALDREDATAARIADLVGRLDRPRVDPDIEAVRGVLPGSFSLRRGAHVLLLHQHSEAEAQERVEFLETVLRGFYLEFALLGIDLEVPAERHVVAWFARRGDYVEFLNRENAGAFRTTRGYYHPTRRLVALYDARSDDPRWEGSRRDRAEEQPAREPDGSEKTADRATGRETRRRREEQRRRLLAEMSWRGIDHPIAAHELVHQLVAASRLAPAGHAFPKWLHEGLAMQFEGVRGGRWGGLRETPALRLTDWRSLSDPGTLAGLLRDEGLERGYHRSRYAEAWSFVHYLRTREEAGWVRLLDGLRVPVFPGEDARGRARGLLVSGSDRDLLDWERGWRRHLRRSDPAAKAAAE